MLELDREAPQQAETVPSHYNKVASCMPGSILPPNARAVDCNGGALGDSQLGNQSAFRPRHIAEKERTEKNVTRWCKHMLGNEEPNRIKQREKEEPRRETDLEERRQVVARAVFLAH